MSKKDLARVGWVKQVNVGLRFAQKNLTRPTWLVKLRGFSFNWKDNAQNAESQIGLIAQEVEKVLPEWVSTDSEGYKSIGCGSF